MFPAARLALWVRLTLRLWRVLHTRHALSAAGIRGWTAALDPRFPVGAWRTGVNGFLGLRAALDPSFPVDAWRAGIDATLRLRATLDTGFPVGAWRTGVHGALSLRAALDTRIPVGTGVEPLSALRRSALDPRFSMTAASERGCIRCRSRRRGEGRDA